MGKDIQPVKSFISNKYYEIDGRGKAYIVMNDADHERSELGKTLIGKYVEINGEIFKVRGVESFAVPMIRKGQYISLLVY